MYHDTSRYQHIAKWVESDYKKEILADHCKSHFSIRDLPMHDISSVVQIQTGNGDARV